MLTAGGLSTGSDTVLVVDDDPEIADLLLALLEAKGYPATAAGTLAEARDRANGVGVVLLDLALPDGHGEALLKELRARADAPDVLIITGHATLETAIAAVEAGAAGYISKPFDLAELETRVDELLTRRRSAAETALRHRGLAQRLRETEALLSVASTVSSTLDLVEALRRICRVLAGLIAADTASVYLLDRDSGALVPKAGYRVPREYLETLASTPLPVMDQGFYLPIWTSREPVWSDDVATDPRFSHDLFRRLRHQSGLLLPLVLDDAVAGAVYFAWWQERRTFAPHELKLLEHVCGQLTALLKNARGWEQAERDRERLQALNEVSRRLASVTETDEVLDLIVREAERLLGGAAAGIRLIEGDRLVVRARTESAAPLMAREQVPIGESLSGHIVATGEPLVVTDLAGNSAFDPIHKANAVALGFTGFLGVPMHLAGRIIGCFNLFVRDNRSFGFDDVSLLTALADQAALALEKARLLEVSERQRRELTRIFDSTSDGMLLLDRAGTVLRTNRQAAELLAFDAPAAGEAHLTALLAEHVRDTERIAALWASLQRLLETPGGSGTGDLELATLGRTVCWTAQTTRDSAGSVDGLTLTVRDVTEERHVSRLKSDFVSFVTHQLRTPVSGINWLLELAAETPDVPEDLSGLLTDARQASGRLTRLVNDLLEIGRLESGRVAIHREPTDLATVTAEVLDDLAALLQERRHQLVVDAEPGLIVHVDPQLIRQALWNLTSNAFKYTPNAGRIDIRLRREEGGICWSVQDTGIGIPRAALAKLFEKFYRADNVVSIETEGTGLGLYLARLIIERSGGQLTCTSEEGQGSTFFMRLPLKGAE
jgi:signal transduction histidine kinase/FixJ family two-component response regulator